MKIIKYVQLLLVLVSLTPLVAGANDWIVVPEQSQLNFISVKKSNVAEVHQFKSVSGQWDSKGELIVDIDLATVETGIEIRNQRMRELLFDVSQFSKATLKSFIDVQVIDELTISETVSLIVTAQLSLHGQIRPVELTVRVTKLSSDKILVISDKPTILNVADFDLIAGVEQLREVAKLPSISHAVPVSFYLTFKTSN
ncbi:MAG: YceI family protein [Gammaproteobacteria bacterium]|nr:YceI family protein [Gammaproteobacteria bacterium]